MSRSPHDQIWTKIQFWIHNSIQIYQGQPLSIEKTYWGQCKAFLKIEGQKSSLHDQIGAKIQFGILNCFQMYHVETFVDWKHSMGQYLAFLKIRGSKVKVTRLPNDGKSAVEPKLYFNIPGCHLCQLKTLIGAVLNIFENLRVKCQGHQMTKCQQKYNFWAITPF